MTHNCCWIHCASFTGMFTFFPGYFRQLAHPVLFIGSVDLSSLETLNFPCVVGMVFTEQHLCPHVRK